MQQLKIQEQWVLPLDSVVVLPEMRTKIAITDHESVNIKTLLASGNNKVIGLSLKNDSEEGKYIVSDFYEIGVILNIDSLQESDSGYVIHVEGLNRVRIEHLFLNGYDYSAKYTNLQDDDDLDTENASNIKSFIQKYVKEISSRFQGTDSFVNSISQIDNLDNLMANLIPYMQISVDEKQQLLEQNSKRKRALFFMDLLVKQKDKLDLQVDISNKVNERINKSQREILLREQLKAIQDELGENKGSANNKKDYRALIAEAGMPKNVEEVAFEQLSRLESLGQQNPETNIIQNYLDLLVALPWKPGLDIEIDIERAREILDDEHYGLKEVKERIIQHLAVMKLKRNKKGSILLLVGPPGTGKTSIGKSIANALDREYVRFSMGGMKDEAEIRGHRRTYIGALPGRIIQGMKKAGQKNPVFVLDEIDKLMTSYSGDPASALLEVLDPEQNNTFVDHYLEVPYDLSEVFFVATANSLSTIPGPLRDRMEIIDISSYTNNEKFHIGKNHLVDTIVEEHGLDSNNIKIEDEALSEIITGYTREAGVRGLKKQLSKLVRIATEKIVSKKVEMPYTITKEMLSDMLGKPKVRLDNSLKDRIPGVITGLAWTPVGGDILYIESSSMAGKGNLILTGQLGSVMKESATISLSLIRSRMQHLVSNFDFSSNDIHIHVPSGAIPKDGPSAGITLFTTLASMLLGKGVDPKTAMTGEITLRGTVMPVGGIKEKVLAAHRAGIKKIILSKENSADLAEVPEDVRNDLMFVLVESIEEVVKETLDIDLPKPTFYQTENISNNISQQ
ncbi:endopeptidase La [Puteibacter caeruleilacunae]|nr:endopeptidase La [Puteibacter caeruleilacunae]